MNRLTRSAFRALVALTLVACAWSAPAFSCSCFESKERASHVRAWVKEAFRSSSNIVLVRATKVTTVGEDHEQAILEVVEFWKGAYPVGSVVISDTEGIGGGMCDMSIRVGESYLAFFESEPISISGCPSSFVLTKLEEKYLNRYARKRPNKSLERTREG